MKTRLVVQKKKTKKKETKMKKKSLKYEQQTTKEFAEIF